MKNKGYKKLIVWQKADELAYQVYIKTKGFPKEEMYWNYFSIKKSSFIYTY